MEIKTCEEYVLNQLSLAEEEVYSLRKELTEIKDRLRGVIKSYNELEELIYKLVNVSETAGEGLYLCFNGIFEKYDRDDFEKITRLIPYILKPKD